MLATGPPGNSLASVSTVFLWLLCSDEREGRRVEAKQNGRLQKNPDESDDESVGDRGRRGKK